MKTIIFLIVMPILFILTMIALILPALLVPFIISIILNLNPPYDTFMVIFIPVIGYFFYVRTKIGQKTFKYIIKPFDKFNDYIGEL